MTRSEWLALSKRCEEAKGPDREIDRAIFCAFNPEFSGPEWKWYGMGLRHECDGSDARTLPSASHTPARYTASLDTLTALIERELPGWSFGLHTHLKNDVTFSHAEAGLSRAYISTAVPSLLIATASTTPLALCAAFCRAMAERTEA